MKKIKFRNIAKLYLTFLFTALLIFAIFTAPVVVTMVVLVLYAVFTALCIVEALSPPMDVDSLL